ncbi:MAG: FHA domain-containing protein [Acidobacteriota bacterium]|nr:FHA domain-containing protein [Acidobacteriota bacterium]
MKIVLAEERDGTQLNEKTFSQETIRIGRDPAICEIVFEQAAYPMVSRKHAELRFKDGGCLLIDSNSSYGTFLNGQRVSQPIAVAQGATIQFGLNGPVLHVRSLELPALNDSIDFLATYHDAPAADQMPKSFAKPAGQTLTAVLQPLENAGATPIEIKKEIITLGRSPENDFAVDAASAVVSRRHAEIRRQNGQFVVIDNGSFNGTFINERRVVANEPTPLSNGDEIRLGLGGPILRFIATQAAAPQPASARIQATAEEVPRTLVGTQISLKDLQQSASAAQPPHAQLLLRLDFSRKSELIIGRAETSDIRLDGLQISNRHARLLKTANGVVIEDAGSTNGVYIGGKRISGRAPLAPADTAQIGPFQLRVDPNGNVFVFDTRSKTRIDALHITKIVKNRADGAPLKLLDDVSLAIQPNEFVGLLGPSGAGKSTLMDALNGMRPPTTGSVLINNLDFYSNLDSLKQGIGYVPQEDIIHRQLTVYRTLYYVAKLRLSRDVSGAEIDQIINEVLDVTGLAERRDVLVSELSGGQRKRVSIAVELITKPSVIFLDEPTSGLDPATEDKIMKLFRRIAESGRTVILTTHAMENVRLFDKIVVLMRGKLVFYGTPNEALKYLGAASFKELYDKLEEPIENRLHQATETNQAEFKRRREQITEEVAENWKQKFLKTPEFRRNVYEPLGKIAQSSEPPRPPKRQRLGIFGSVRQTLTLTRRYFQVLFRDKLNLAILLLQAPIIAFMLALVIPADAPRDFVYFVLTLVAIWFGTSVAAREIVREKPVYRRERMINLGLLPYLLSKLLVLGFVVGFQILLLFLPLKFLDLANLMKMPGVLAGLPQLFVLFLTAATGIALGLFISALVKTSEMATSLVPLILIPQILFSGLVGVPTGASRVVGLAMPASWSFDAMKRFSGLDTLEPEGSNRRGANEGKGLYKWIEDRNAEIENETREEFEDYKRKMKSYMADLKNGIQATEPPAPDIKSAEKLPTSLHDYVTFLHPWMNIAVNQAVLLIMFFGLVLATLFALRRQDIR